MQVVRTQGVEAMDEAPGDLAGLFDDDLDIEDFFIDQKDAECGSKFWQLVLKQPDSFLS